MLAFMYARAAHVRELADTLPAELNVTLSWWRRFNAYSHSVPEGSPGRVTIAPVIDEETYFIALHELGHCASKHMHRNARGNGSNHGIVMEEVEAWQWALDNTMEPASPHIWNEVERCLTEYMHVYRCKPDPAVYLTEFAAYQQAVAL